MNLSSIRLPLGPLIALALSGCIVNTQPISYQQISPKNYQQKIEITYSAARFFKGKYIGNEKGCFPPINGRDCYDGTHDIYKSLGALNLELYTLVAASPDGWSTKTIEEYLNMAAADFTLQKGFRFFSVISKAETTTCSTRYSADTYGSSSGGIYSATTTLNKTGSCIARTTLTVLAFNRPAELAEGVFISNNNSMLRPYTSLYLLDMKGLRLEDFDILRKDDLGGTSTTYYRGTRRHAWKHFYDAQGVSDDFHRKFNVPRENYSYTDEELVDSKRNQGDVMRKNKIGY